MERKERATDGEKQENESTSRTTKNPRTKKNTTNAAAAARDAACANSSRHGSSQFDILSVVEARLRSSDSAEVQAERRKLQAMEEQAQAQAHRNTNHESEAGSTPTTSTSSTSGTAGTHRHTHTHTHTHAALHTATRPQSPPTCSTRPRNEKQLPIESDTGIDTGIDTNHQDDSDSEELDLLKLVEARIQEHRFGETTSSGSTQRDNSSQEQEPNTGTTTSTSPNCAAAPASRVRRPCTATGSPGAYSEAPGESIRRAERLRFSLVGQIPEMLVGSGSESESDGNVPPTTQTLKDMEEGAMSPAATEDTGLVVAQPIQEQDPPSKQGLPEAENFDTDSYHSRISQKEEEHKIYRTRIQLTLLGLLIAIIGVVLVIVLVDNGSPQTSSGNNITGPSDPSTLSSEAYLESLLPDYTLQAIHYANNTDMSPQYQAWQWSLEDPALRTYPEWRVVQRFALVCFYHATGGARDKWENNSHWLSYQHPETEWYNHNPLEYGIVKNGTLQALLGGEEGRIQYLSLPENGLENSLLPLELYLLTDLRFLSLYNTNDGSFEEEDGIENNRFEGTISSHIGMLTRLVHLSIENNNMSGSLPSEVGLLSALTTLSVSGNSLHGQLPTEIGKAKQLQYVYLEGNSFSGNIPSEIGLLTNIEHLRLNSNGIGGSLPSELGLLSQMYDFRAQENLLDGSIPSEIGAWSRVGVMDLSLNGITGALPTTLGLLGDLFGLELYGNWMTGEVPSEFGLMSSLQYLYLEGNILSSSVPSEIGSMTSLIQLHLNENMLSGQLPSELGLLEELAYLKVSGNSLIGSSLPTELGNAKSLHTFEGGACGFTGPIPSELGQLDGLAELSLYENELTSSIPEELWGAKNSIDNVSWSKMKILYLDHNLLSGSIPEFPVNGGEWHLQELFLQGNVNLTGSIPSEIGRLQHLKKLGLYGLNLYGSIPSEIGSCFQLNEIVLRDNVNLTGSLPKDLSELANLDRLDLTGCAVGGRVPEKLCDIAEFSFDCSPSLLCGCDCGCS
ncbi:leucine rich repeat [Seminavis robusta]|uniref:Leucine rich repeat n=1 Tax=Seminavis robusta TaxID=568900 RepID=A0A9N8D5K2_9STRA|nr:leucine rich repeat [Seminavis robusta]|eukprot:Sro10_g008370.1 leucine rich repeat (1015) ;mRNA; r:215415-218732